MARLLEQLAVAFASLHGQVAKLEGNLLLTKKLAEEVLQRMLGLQIDRSLPLFSIVETFIAETETGDHPGTVVQPQ